MNIFKLVSIIAILMGLNLLEALPLQLPASRGMAWISTTQNPILGSGLLLAYTAGYVSPLVLAGTFTASIKKLLALRQWSGWITPTSGVLLVGFGVISLLSRLVPIT